MFPILLQTDWLVIPTFSFMLMVASLAATFYSYFQAPKKGLSQTIVLDMGIIGTIAGILGARIFHVLVEAPAYYWEHPSYIYQIQRGGVVSYGGLILIGISLFVYLKIKKVNPYQYLDLMALGFPIVVFFVRIGCLGAGCCYGKPTDFFFHLIFHSGSAGQQYFGIPLHATQVYDMLNAVFLFFLMRFIDARKKFHGQVVWSFLIGYGVIRGVIEFLRGDVDRGVYLNGSISTAQVVGIVAILFGGMMYWYCRYLSSKTHSSETVGVKA